MKLIRLLTFLQVFMLLSFHGTAGLTIVDNHKSSFVIQIPASPDHQEIRASSLLQRYLLKISACKLPVVRTNALTSADAIIIRSSDLVINPDGFIIQTVGNQLFITGGVHKGCIYGVVDLLERQLGCRKYSPDYEVVPKSDMVYLPDLNYRDEPVNSLRIVNGAFCMDEDYLDWQRLDQVPEVFPDGYYVHTFHKLIPWEHYFEGHPEYFAWMNGKRIIDQPCLSNPDVFQITVDKLREEMAKQSGKQIWSVSQNDNFSYCQCDNCLKIIEEERSPAGPVIRFVNAVADSFPDKTISTLAYQYSRSAPVKTKPRENVQVMLCTIELNRSKPIAEDSTSTSFVKDLENWGRICDHIYLWDYTVNFNHHVNPFPNLHVLQPNIQLFANHGIREHFQQTNTGNGHECAELKAYLIARLLWNPTLNADSVIQDFLDGYYGEASPMIGAYLAHLHREMTKSGERLDIYEHPTAHQNSVLSARNTLQYNRLFDKATKAVGDDPDRLLHVRTARLPLQYSIMEIGKNDMFGPRGWYLEEGDSWKLKKEMAETLEIFYRICQETGVQSLNESGLTPEIYYIATKRFIDVQVEGNLAFRKSVTAEPAPSNKYSSGELNILTNGVFGANDFRAHWLGWEGENFSLEVDLGALEIVDTIAISTLWEGKSWIFHPVSIVCSTSPDGKNWTVAGDQQVEGDQRNEPLTRQFFFRSGGIQTRYIRFEVTGLLKNPDWHPSAGGGCWVFVDEIVVSSAH
ncbi:MAG: DUF4838 domain-containing protein [Bacteroidales bacterium]|nr:DUF4838 domain-containing protein [Bacteroidales bacterium]